MMAPRIAQSIFSSFVITTTFALAACSAGPESSTTSKTCNAQAALGKTIEVGPGKAYASLQQVASLVQPGDLVEVYAQASPYAGSVVFSQSGAKDAPITIRGIAVNGKRPVISGGDTVVQFDASHYVFDGFEVSSGNIRNIFHHGDDITITNTSVHDCAGHGILGADQDSGSLTLDHVEVYACGNGDTKHPVYMATDEVAHPGSVFRMQFCYLHDQKGGNNVKSRAERNEIYYNWIEGGFYREIELIGPEDTDPALKREDSDVVGNVFYKTQGTNVARLGGDGDADTSGRYRFVNNTFILQANSPAAIQLFDRVESVELHDNVFHRLGGGAIAVFNTENVQWVSGEVIAGDHNWVPTGTTTLTDQVTSTLSGADPGFVDVAHRNVQLATSSPLSGAGVLPTTSPNGHPFPSPLAAPAYDPPLHTVDAPGQAVTRPSSAKVAVGAYETGAQSTGSTPIPVGGTPPPAGGTSGTGGASSPSTGQSGAGQNGGTTTGKDGPSDGC